MIVCQCRGISDRDVRDAVRRGAVDLADLAAECGAGADCRGCHATLEDLLPRRPSFAFVLAGRPAPSLHAGAPVAAAAR